MSSQVIGLTDLLDSAVSNQLWLYLGTAFVIIILVAQRWSQGTRCRCGASLIGKSVVITGASDGIGVPTAHAMARRGARVIMACRNVGKAERVATQIRRETGNGNVIVMKCDLASLSSVRQFCDNYMGCETRLDILINNAGIMACPYSKTVDGFEMQMGVNHFGHFLLTNLLTPLLVQSAPSRVVVLTSEAHRGGQINFEDINSEKQYSPFKGYFQSKLANVLFATELHNRLSDRGVSVFSVHPGVVDTKLHRNLPWHLYLPIVILQPLYVAFLRGAASGAQTTIHCAVSEGLEKYSGGYFSDCSPALLASHAGDTTSADRLWQMSEKMVGMQPTQEEIIPKDCQEQREDLPLVRKISSHSALSDHTELDTLSGFEERHR